MTTDRSPERSAPRVACVNLPNRWTLVRRFMCTYYSAAFKLAPYELLQLAVCARDWGGAEVHFLDAIAEECGEAGFHEFVAKHRIDIVVALIGVETVSADLACLDRLKSRFPHVTTVVFGYYPTEYSEEVLRKTTVDIILRNEPERSFADYLKARQDSAPLATLDGLASRDAHGAIFVNDYKRIMDLDALPLPDYGMCDVRRYEEWLLGGPCGTILSARGCPFSCTYCTSTYGKRLILKSPEAVVAEVKAMLEQGIRVVRFLDDTFTTDKKRVIAICQAMVKEGAVVPWSCLARIDTLDAAMLDWMKRAGCVRVAVGVESYAKNVLAYLGKQLDPTEFNGRLRLIREAGMECAGTFIVGAPVETEADFEATVRGVLESPLDLIGVNVLAPYGGTPFFERMREELEFNLIPYTCQFKDAALVERGRKRERQLYRRFYLRPQIVWRQLGAVLRFPRQSLRLLLMLFRFSVWNRPTSQ